MTKRETAYHLGVKLCKNIIVPNGLKVRRKRIGYYLITSDNKELNINFGLHIGKSFDAEDNMLKSTFDEPPKWQECNPTYSIGFDPCHRTKKSSAAKVTFKITKY